MKFFKSFFSLSLMLMFALTLVFSATKTTLAADPTSPTASAGSEEQILLGLINDYRNQKGLGNLTFDPSLQTLTNFYSQDLGDNNYFSHTDLLGQDPFQRMANFGVDRGYEGEDLAAGRGTAAEVLTQWQNSPAHNAVLLTPEYTLAGLSSHFNSNSTYGWYWTLDVSSN